MEHQTLGEIGNESLRMCLTIPPLFFFFGVLVPGAAY